jgi:hypothetical protein
VVFTELVQVFCWFNPFLILYRKSIQLNHEFLADAEVLDNYTDVKAYQYTLLSSLSATSGLNMTSQFSYALTKKRLLMMTRKTSLTTSILSRIATLLIVGIVFVVFCNATVSRKNESATKHITTKISNFDTTAVNQLIPFQSFVDIQHYEHTEKGVPQNLLDEYHAIIQKNQFKPGMTFKRWREMIGSEAELRMIAIYKQMSAEQQANEAVGFAYFNPPTPAYSITDAQLKAYKDPYIYLTYVNGYQGKRSKLGTYKAADLKKISFEKLTGEKWNYKVMLVTNKAYDDIYKEEVERKGKSAMIFKTPKGAVQTTIKPVPVTYANGKPFVPVIAPLQQKSTTKIVFPRPYPSTEAGVSQTLLDEYAAIIQKYEDTWGNIPPKERKLDEKDRAMLITIYRQMSLAQQAKQIITFQYGFPPSPSVKPTQAQINAFKDDHVYGVWIDDKKVANSELDKYKPADFGGVLISTLTKNAINYKRYRYEVSLMTVDFNNAMRKEISDKQYTDHMWTKMGPGGFAIKNDKYRVKKSASAVKVPNDDKVNAVTYIRPREGVPPTAAELAYYQRDDFYWVFINDKKIRNNQLSNYKPEELLRVYEKEPSQSGEVLSKYTNVVQFMTLDRYNKYHTTAMAL